MGCEFSWNIVEPHILAVIMKIDITSMFFNSRIEGQTATPAWGTSIGQNKSRKCRIDDFKQDVVDMVIGMTYKSVADLNNLDVSKGSSDRDIVTCSVFNDVFINNKKIEGAQYVLLLVREHSKSHDGRLLISYAPYIKYNDVANQSCIDEMQRLLNCTPEGCWFVYDISIKNQSELYFSAVVVNPSSPMIYSNSIKSKNRSEEWKSLIPSEGESDSNIQKGISESLQQIFYGAPGTGKSNTIKSIVDDQNKICFRTTFHPDSDYSTFVGAYKPSMDKDNNSRKVSILDYEGMVDKFKEYIEATNNNITQASVLFGHDYHDSIVNMLESTNHKIPDLVTEAYKSGTTYDTNVRAGMRVYEDHPQTNNQQIVYKFIPQAFTKAYVEAWNTTEDVYLIIEEINRGNCAQIFGDLFQLLDRKNGVSEYPIDADADLADYIEEALRESLRLDIPIEVKTGKKLMLPSNLYIWATMNTSDQSLFPIDSAFKRRWNWVYIPIKPHDEENYRIEIGTSTYNWWGFLEKINQVIDDTTSSEDKKLGYFFVKAEDKVIKADKFVSKVLFYLWNDVFKNYGFDNPIFSKGENKKFTFSDFFQKDGTPNTVMVNAFLGKLDENIDKEHSFIETKLTEESDTEQADNEA